MRAFISLKLDEEARNKFRILQNEIKNLCPDNSDKIKWENINNSHITLFFLGEIEEKTAKEICSDLKNNASEKYGTLNLSFRRISAFPNIKNPSVIIAELDNPDGNIYKLNDDITTIMLSYGFEQNKKFHPHLTIGRIRKGMRVNLPDFGGINYNLFLNFGEFLFNKSVLSINGAKHHVFERFGL